MHPDIPEKTYYKIGEVARLAELKASVLRFWEAELPFLKPEKSSTGQRLYTRQDIDLVIQIKQLLYHEKYTIEGVRKKLAPRKSRKNDAKFQSDAGDDELFLEKLQQIRQELLQLRSML